MYYESNNYLQHFGVKGMKWGVRRYQKSDGSLTLRGKRLSKKYKKYAGKARQDLSIQTAKSGENLYVKSYNKVADKMNNGGFDKFEKKHEKLKSEDHDAYDEALRNHVQKAVLKQYSIDSYNYYKNNKNFKKAQALADKYKMYEWDKLARDNQEEIDRIKKLIK